MKNSLFLLPLLAVLVMTCKPKEKFHGFDSEIWKQDQKACQNKRGGLLKNFPNFKSELKSMDDDDLTDLLGNPEKTFYYGRGRRDYVYFISPGSQCNKTDYTLEGRELVIEINALGYVTIATEQQGK